MSELPAREWSNDELALTLERFRASRAREAVAAPADASTGYYEAAAVLVLYDPETLAPVGEPPPAEVRSRVLAQLMADSTIVFDELHQPRWMLRAEVRKECLRRLADQGRLLTALAANRAPALARNLGIAQAIKVIDSMVEGRLRDRVISSLATNTSLTPIASGRSSPKELPTLVKVAAGRGRLGLLVRTVVSLVPKHKNEPLLALLVALQETGLDQEAPVEEGSGSSFQILQEMLDSYLAGVAPPMEAQDAAHLGATLQIIEWTEGQIAGLPEADAVRARLEYIHLFQPFHYLAGGHFRGRERELRELRNYVEAIPPGISFELLRRTARRLLRMNERPPLVLYAAGGMGKSSLLARFILEHTQAQDQRHFPFVYLDFDRPGLVADQPVTLLLEIVRQLGLQYPSLRPQCNSLHQTWSRQLARWQEGSRSEASSRKAYVKGSLAARGTAWRPLLPPGFRREAVRDLAEIVFKAKLEREPFLLVLDTFEEVQYRSQEFVRELWSFLEELQTVIPRLRTVLSGRVAVELSGVEVVPLKLEDLDVRSAEEVLHAQGLARPVAARLAAFLGGNPLSLRLVFQYLHQEFKGKRADEITVDDLRLDEIQRHDAYGYLFGRILDHIHDERVKQLAHPGLVLRRVTPALIREVLAKPCNLTLESNADAEELFAKLSREVALVATEEGGDALRHRPDVRRVMLDRLRVTEPSKVRDIHQRAVAYYEQLPEGSVVARAEEIYHRLSLERQLEEVDARWRDDLRAYFPVDSIEELPMSAQLYLAARFDFDLPHLRWAEARLEDWERHAERRARDLLRRGEPQKALAVLGARTDRSSSSPLLLLQAEAHEQLGQTEAALRAGDAVVNSAAVPHSTRDAYDQTLEAARQAERLGDLRLAEERLAAAAQLAGSLDDPARQLEVLVRRLSFVRRRQDTAPNAPADPEVVCQLQDEAAALFAENAWKDILSTSLLHALAAEVGGTKPPLLKQIMAQASLPEPVTPEQTHALIEVLSGWEERLLEEAGGEPFPLARAAGLPLAGTSAETWKRLADDAGPATLASVVSSLLVSYALDTETAVGIAGFLQRSVTSAEGTALSQ